jgi:hypothetical protein
MRAPDIKKPDTKTPAVDPAVLTKVAQIAKIKDFPLTGSLLEISGLKDYQKELDQSLIKLMDQLGVIQTTNRKQFENRIRTNIKTAQDHAAWRNAARLKTAKIEHLARQLKETLKASPPELSHYLQSFECSCSLDQCIAAVSVLTESAQRIKHAKKTIMRPGRWAGWDRRIFIEALLNATQAAGGKLGVNPRNGRGSLVEVIDLLRPYLPAEFQTGLSVATLRQIKSAWLKSRKNNLKNADF